MSTNMPFGYIVLEGQNDIMEATNIEVIDKPNLFYVRFNTVLQSLDCRNRNGRQYRGDAIVKGLSDDNITELIAKNKWKGERDHPITKNIQRIASVLSKESSHRITKWWRDGNLIRGTIETLDDDHYGTQLTKNILQGEIPSFSMRGLAMLEKRGNTTFVDRPPRIITYDEVNLPSHPEAYADPIKGNVSKDSNGNTVCESTDVGALYTGTVFAIEATDIKDMLVSKSDNLKIVCESFDIDPNSVKITDGGRSLALCRDGDTFVFTLEQSLQREVSNFWNIFR